jgi:hypothetical protein
MVLRDNLPPFAPLSIARIGDASRLATILGAMRQCLEASELEQRITEMEAALAVNTRPSSVVPFRKRMR